MAEQIFLWQLDQYLLDALNSQAISYKEAMQLAFFDQMIEESGLETMPLPESLWPILDKISLSQTEGARH